MVALRHSMSKNSDSSSTLFISTRGRDGEDMPPEASERGREGGSEGGNEGGGE